VAGGTYSVVVTNAAGTVTSGNAVITVLNPPTISVQPQSATNLAGTSASFTVTASGTAPLAYQWQFNAAPIAGATTSGYSIASVSSANAGSYRVIVTNTAGMATSSVAVLTVHTPPSITVQPQSQTVIAGSNVTFSVTAAGDATLAYQWAFGGTNVAGATTSAYALTGVTTNSAGNYSAVVTNSWGTITSSIATLTVTSGPAGPAIISGPSSATVTQGNNASFTVTMTGTEPLYYSWKFNGSTVQAGTAIATYIVTGATTNNAGSYSVVVTNTSGTATSTNAVLTVLVPAYVLTQPTNLTIVAGSNATFDVVVGGFPAPGYQWQLNGSSISGATTNSYSTNAVVVGANGSSYSVVVTNSSGTVTSAVAVLTVTNAATAPAITSQPTSLINLLGSSATFTVGVSGTSPVYQWRFNQVVIAGATSTAYTIASVQNSNAGSYYLIATNTAGGATSAVATLAVITPVSITSQPQSVTNLQGSTATFSVGAAGTAPIAYQWAYSGNPVAGATASAYSVVASTNNQGPYQCVLTNAGGSITSAVANLTTLVIPYWLAQQQSAVVTQATIVTLASLAGGSPSPAYRWRFNGTNMNDSAGVSGSSTPTLIFPASEPTTGAPTRSWRPIPLGQLRAPRLFWAFAGCRISSSSRPT
jgi:hypothetical protein